MKVVSWNCKGTGSKEKNEYLGKLIHIERPSILLIQETKVRESEVIQEMQRIWRKSKSLAISASGSLGGLCTLWSSDLFQLEESHQEVNWILVKLIHIPSGMIYHIVNIYMPTNYWKKID
jgi:exonuclease III